MGNETDADDETDRRVKRARDALLKGPSAGLVLKYYKWHLKQGFIRWVMERPRRWVQSLPFSLPSIHVPYVAAVFDTTVFAKLRKNRSRPP